MATALNSSSLVLPRVVVLDDYQNVAINSADWSILAGRATIDVLNETISNEDTLAQRLAPYQIICSMRERTKFPASFLDRLPNLRLLTTTGQRNAAIDVAHANSKGIIVSGTGSGGNATVEHIWALILAVTRRIVEEHNNIRNAKPQWQSVIPFGLSGKTLGLIGLGRLGTKTAEIARVFGMNVIAWSPHMTPERAAVGGADFVSSKEELLKRSDIVSIHMVLSPTTRGLVTAQDLALMKPTAYLINTSRGPLIDEGALVQTLEQGGIAGAGLDVYDTEPLPLDHPLRTLPNATLSPHNAYVDDTTYGAYFGQTVENITAFLDGKPVRILA